MATTAKSTGKGRGKMPRGTTQKPRFRRMRGFEAAGGLLRDPIRKVTETRGFAVTNLLTHWDDIAGPDIAPICRPVKVSYAQKGSGLGATLTVLASGAAAPLVQMQCERLRERVNGVYGYAAIARVRVTQTSAHGLAGQTPHKPAPDESNIAPPSPAALARARSVVDSLTEGVSDTGLRDALDRLATNVLTRERKAPGPRF